MKLGRVPYRIRQFLGVTSTKIRPEEREQIERLLNPVQQALFWNMKEFSRRHCLNVYHTLVREGVEDKELLVAALLHDVGKGDVRMSHRVAIVLLSSLWPSLLPKLAKKRSNGWRHGLFLSLHHAERGAALVEKTGASPRVVEMVRLHETDVTTDPEVRALRLADEAN